MHFGKEKKQKLKCACIVFCNKYFSAVDPLSASLDDQMFVIFFFPFCLSPSLSISLLFVTAFGFDNLEI